MMAGLQIAEAVSAVSVIQRKVVMRARASLQVHAEVYAQLLNGVYLATPQLNEGAPVFHHGLGYLLTRERIRDRLGWVIGMPPSVWPMYTTGNVHAFPE